MGNYKERFDKLCELLHTFDCDFVCGTGLASVLKYSSYYISYDLSEGEYARKVDSEDIKVLVATFHDSTIYVDTTMSIGDFNVYNTEGEKILDLETKGFKFVDLL